MNKQFSMLLVLAISIVVPQIGNAQTANFSKSKVNMVASVHPLATQAGLRAFENGGNAVDDGAAEEEASSSSVSSSSSTIESSVDERVATFEGVNFGPLANEDVPRVMAEAGFVYEGELTGSFLENICKMITAQ